ncbi:MAG: amidohydrolase family protein [Candidatus Aminicenantales bacterium]
MNTQASGRAARLALAMLVLVATAWPAGQAASLSPAVKAFVSFDAPIFAITRVRVIDGTGAPAREDQTIVVSGGKILALGDAGTTAIPAGAETLEMPGHTVFPGIVGLHDHIFYPAGAAHYNTLEFSAPRLYLACGVTTIRTTGSLEPYTELNLKKAIAEGRVPGPRMHVTSPYLEGPGAFTLQMHELSGPAEAVKFVQYWESAGVDDFKAYTNIRRDELAAAIKEVHRLGKKLTGHLCSIGFREAAALGIDDLEHGLIADTEFAASKKPDVCPSSRDARAAIIDLDLSGPAVRDLIQDLVAHGVAVTSTLPVFEISVPGRPPLDPRVLEAMSTETRLLYLTQRSRVGETKDSPMPGLLKREMEFERMFVKAGGLLIAGPDPTGYGGVLPGFGDQREIELLVEAGFSAVEALKIATSNGARYLGRLDALGTLEAGKLADMVLVKGDPTASIADIRKVVTVFKDGIGYDPAKLLEAVRGTAGLR